MLAPKIRAQFERAVALDPALLEAREDLLSFYVQAPGFMGGGLDKAMAQAEEIRKLDALRGHGRSPVSTRTVEKALKDLK